jgi:hypothetical protein
MRIAVRVVCGLLCLALGAGTALAQTALKPGGVVAGGGSSASAGYALRGSIGAGPGGASTSAGYVVQGGIIGSLTLGPVFAVPALSTPPAAGSNVTITATVSSGSGATLQLYYRLSGQTDWPNGPVTMSTSDQITYSGVIPGSVVGSRSLEYYVLATQSGQSSTRPASNPTTVPYVQQVALTNAGTTLPDAVYRLFSFPFEIKPGANTVATVFQDDLGDTNSTQWKLGRWDPALGQYKSYADVGTIARGQGYWLIARGGKRVDADGTSPVPDTAPTSSTPGYARITLQPGWNMIGTPFDFQIAWSQRVEDVPAEIEDAAQDYVNGSYTNAANLLPYHGYWVRNTGTVNHVLSLPFAAVTGKEAAGGDPARSAASADQWSARLVLSGGGIVDRGQVLGVRPEARDGYDSADYSRPPDPPGASLSLMSLVNDSRGVAQALEGDFRAPGAAGTGQRFALLVRGTIDAAARLALAGDSALPDGFGAAVIDVPTATAYALPAGGSLTLPRRVSGDGDRYDLVIGPNEWVHATAGEVQSMPTRVALSPNYPNPFNPQTTIAFDLPAPGSARVRIYDAAGRLVITLWDRDLPAGHHTVKWDGRGGRGRPAASGPYFCRLEAAGVTLSHRMMLVR